MRVLAAVAVALSVLAGPSIANTKGDVTASPARVKFGPVPVEAPDCHTENGIPSSGCTTATITVTNTGTEPVVVFSVSVCNRVSEGPSCILDDRWGGMASDELSTCLSLRNGLLRPGRSCAIVLIAIPGREGTIKGFLLMTTDEGSTTLLTVPVKVRGV
jgi:hypothetical protein